MGELESPSKLDELLARHPLLAAPGLERPNAAFNQKQVEEKKARQRLFLETIATGLGPTQAAQRIGISKRTYDAWRKRDREFAQAVDRVKAENHAIESADEGNLDLYRGFDGSFESFRKVYFGWDTYWHQKQIIKAIEDAPGGRITLVLCPPEHGKTTVLEDYINYQLAMFPNFRITYVHEGQDFARKVMRRVTMRMQDAELYGPYIARFGPFFKEGQGRENKGWTSDHITMAKAQHDERDYSLQVRGVWSSIQGTRTDLLLLDDIQALKTLGRTTKLIEVLRQDYFSRPGKDGKIVAVGTRVGVGDVYEALMTTPGLSELVDVIELPAIGTDGLPLCPEMWSLADLEKKRKLVGEEAWWRNYQQQPMAAGSQTFSEEMVSNARSKQISVGYHTPGEAVGLALDPALSGGNSLIAFSYNRENIKLIDIRLEENLARNEAIMDGIADFAFRYHPSDLIIEAAAFQAGLARDERLLDMSKRMGFRVREHTTSRAKSDPVMGVASMAGAFMRNEVLIPDHEKFEPMFRELLSWRPDIPTRNLKQDTVMSLWFAWKFWAETKQTMGISTSAWNFAAIPWE